ncbi:MAG: hypothetical protein A2270_08180 [Elusimicrobia bacterium RIFOXYA12_FULL_51_18]|nr:MAG: hypothetical protein A2270_08180 [Elusimicrobia bacterium RIFOXYA12_FULL_51_18]OGS30343.1 MAG: hypothetical protein A2218_01630 [Elusimicrobia bacterium RIFOXYA2_FULL_53_38]
MDKNLKKANFMKLANTAAALKNNGFDTEVFEDAAKAGKAVLKLIGKRRSIGMGGSITAETLGLSAALKKAGNEIITHAPGMNGSERIKIWLKAQAAEFYIASPQAITVRGDLLFIDGNGNRAAAVIYGPRKVIVLAGVNKIVRDMDEGLWRIRNVAAIANNIRLKKNNPCVKAGKCENCASPERICNVVSILLKKPRLTDYKVILVNEELGY